jgi:hypothetical protein
MWLEEREPIRVTLLGNSADEEEEEMEMACGSGLR